MTQIKNKARGFYIQVLAAAGGVTSLVLYFVYASALGVTDSIVVAGMVAGIACGVTQLFLKSGIPTLAMTALYSVTIFYFITCTETIGSYADYFSNIVAFGHPELVGHITAIVIVGVISALFAVISCFLPIHNEA